MGGISYWPNVWNCFSCWKKCCFIYVLKTAIVSSVCLVSAASTSWSKTQAGSCVVATFTVASLCSGRVTTLGSGAKFFAALEEKGAQPSEG